MLQDKQNEIRHNTKIKNNAEFLWGWATPAGRLRAERRASMIIEEIRNKGFSNMLEIGSGTGLFTEFFHKADLGVNGIDISWELLDKAKRRNSGAKRLCLYVADVENLPFHNSSFDAVVGICVLHHLNIVAALKEIKRVLKKGGIIIFSEPNMMNPQLMLQKHIKPMKRLLGDTEDETAFFKWQIKRILCNLGFKNIRVRPFDFLHPWTPEFLIPSVKRFGTYFERTPVLKEIAGSLFIYAAK